MPSDNIKKIKEILYKPFVSSRFLGIFFLIAGMALAFFSWHNTFLTDLNTTKNSIPIFWEYLRVFLVFPISCIIIVYSQFIFFGGIKNKKEPVKKSKDPLLFPAIVISLYVLLIGGMFLSHFFMSAKNLSKIDPLLSPLISFLGIFVGLYIAQMKLSK
ncbi:hypothetical protein DLJ48_06925 [Oenococcus sicerae]|uniref:Uncharacterized protein n=1 Tax=Oenococcus sicerae TaxID=2203724 RepID=A0ABX5QNH4_9LACO|nr:hypothetical protein [Oenococcus sicerae]QAS70271.1 hypothetical protein DLJ48_06925 [Oenococcus sicerae]